jgi:hypothetical protein
MKAAAGAERRTAITAEKETFLDIMVAFLFLTMNKQLEV